MSCELQVDVLTYCLEFRHRIELLQDFGFPEAAIRIRTTRDGRFAIATGRQGCKFEGDILTCD
jgi:hypothetical protein